MKSKKTYNTAFATLMYAVMIQDKLDVLAVCGGNIDSALWPTMVVTMFFAIPSMTSCGGVLAVGKKD
nr:hypothetical protein [Tanacetum cinerariifolium]